ncbi:MAG TPA: pantoate--beta-alanine ligase, partial [Caulobacteraceae bacterium]|nr:pantoate--beta-alanine ligase [Caulobacteraceae bacterium]
MTATSLPTARTVADLRTAVATWRTNGQRVALVPTMGYLHDGHLSLVKLGQAKADRVVASLFVNPTQFAPAEDFGAYPRDEARDAALLASAGCDLLYAPPVQEMYPTGFATTVAVAGVSAPMDGIARPIHFAGVAT